MFFLFSISHFDFHASVPQTATTSREYAQKFESTIIIIYFVNSLYENNKNEESQKRTANATLKSQTANNFNVQMKLWVKRPNVCAFEEPWLIVYFIKIRLNGRTPSPFGCESCNIAAAAHMPTHFIRNKCWKSRVSRRRLRNITICRVEIAARRPMMIRTASLMNYTGRAVPASYNAKKLKFLWTETKDLEQTKTGNNALMRMKLLI